MKTYQISKIFFAILIIFSFLSCDNQKSSQPNVLLIVADDMNFDSPGFAGGVAPDVTPNIDRLASEGISFGNAYVTASVCQPSRQSMLSGLLPHNYGSGGFFPMREGTITLPALLREAGYLTGNIHKEHHMLPKKDFNWHYTNKGLGLTAPDGVVGRDPVGMAEAFRKFINFANDKDKPFMMVVNSADPHRPFYGDNIQKGSWYWGNDDPEIPAPSRTYTPNEVKVPSMLPDIPGIRKDLAKYASSVRRLDDCVGECLNVLSEMGKDQNTIVIFVSDNGMPLPFAKFDCYLNSNRTPLLIRWPELIKTPKVINEPIISLMDITPTVLELAGIDVPSPMDGQSFVPFLKDEKPDNWRESIVFLRNTDIYYYDGISGQLERNPDFIKNLEEIGWVYRPDHPSDSTYSREKEMRTYFDGQFGYIYNHCYSDVEIEPGELGAIVPYGDPSFNAMKFASENRADIKERLDFYLMREQEELYEWPADQGSLINLANNLEYADKLEKARAGLLQWMETNHDPLAEAYRKFLKEVEK